MLPDLVLLVIPSGDTLGTAVIASHLAAAMAEKTKKSKALGFMARLLPLVPGLRRAHLKIGEHLSSKSIPWLDLGTTRHIKCHCMRHITLSFTSYNLRMH